MTRYVVWLRGVNVGGRHRLAMADLRAHLADLGYGAVTSYIQSGNLVLDADAPADAATLQAELARQIEAHAGFAVPVVALTAADLAAIAAANPWRDVAGKLCHVVFYPAALPDAVRARVAQLELDGSDAVAVGERVVYLHTPDGFRATTSAARLDRAAPGGTARNLATVAKLIELAA